ncbi:diaphanous like protein, partial [Reticulomyxa filosa]
AKLKAEYESRIEDLLEQLKRAAKEKQEEIDQINRINYTHVQTLLAALSEKQEQNISLQGSTSKTLPSQSQSQSQPPPLPSHLTKKLANGPPPPPPPPPLPPLSPQIGQHNSEDKQSVHSQDFGEMRSKDAASEDGRSHDGDSTTHEQKADHQMETASEVGEQVQKSILDAYARYFNAVDEETADALRWLNRQLYVEKCYQAFTQLFVPEFTSQDHDANTNTNANANANVTHKQKQWPVTELPAVTIVVQMLERLYQKSHKKILDEISKFETTKVGCKILFEILMNSCQFMISKKFEYLYVQLKTFLKIKSLCMCIQKQNQNKTANKEQMNLIMLRCMNFSSLLARKDEETLQLVSDIAGLSGLDKYKFLSRGDPQFEKTLQEYIVKCCEIVWYLLMNEKSGDRFSLFPTIFDVAAYQKCRETFALPMNIKISYRFDNSWCKMLSSKDKNVVVKEPYIYYVWPAVIKISGRGNFLQQEVLQKAVVAREFSIIPSVRSSIDEQD